MRARSLTIRRKPRVERSHPDVQYTSCRIDGRDRESDFPCRVFKATVLKLERENILAYKDISAFKSEPRALAYQNNAIVDRRDGSYLVYEAVASTEGQ